MNRRCVLLMLALSVIFCMILEAARAADSDLPSAFDDSVKKASDVTAQQGTISSAISKAIAKLAQEDASTADQAAARDWLVAQSFVNVNPGSTSASYVSTYTSNLNTALLAQLAKSGNSVRFRVNAALIAAKVTGSVRGDGLRPTVEKLMQDSSAAVVINAIRAAGNIIQSSLKGAATSGIDTLVASVVASVSKNTSGEIGGNVAEEGYKALSPNLKDVAAPQPAALQSVVDGLIKLQGVRVKLYKDKDFPENPVSDAEPLLYMSDSKVWKILKPEQQTEGIQMGVNLIYYAAQSASQLPNNINSPLINTIKRESENISNIIKDQYKDTGIISAMKDALNLSSGAESTKILDAARKAYTAVQASTPAFSSLKDPAAQ